MKTLIFFCISFIIISKINAINYGFLSLKMIKCNGNIQFVVAFAPNCCGNQAYDSYKSICCRKVIHKQNLFTKYLCCGTQLYNPKEQLCCNNTIKYFTNLNHKC